MGGEGVPGVILGLVSLKALAYRNIHTNYNGPCKVYIDSNEIKLSGLGSEKLDGRLTVPIDRTAKWDTIGDDYIRLMDSPCWPWDLYLFHDVCWQHLTDHFRPDEIDLSKLFATLDRLPRLFKSTLCTLVFMIIEVTNANTY